MIENCISQSHIRLRLMREALELTKKDFSMILNVNYRTYNKWEKFERKPSIEALKNMVKLRLNPHYLFGDNNLTINDTNFDNIKESITNELTKRESK